MSEQAYNYQGVLDELYIFQHAVSPKQVKKLAYMEGVSHLTDINTTVDFFVEDRLSLGFRGSRAFPGVFIIRY